MRLLFVCALTLCLGAFGLVAGVVSAEEARPRIAILPVVVHSSDSRSYLREGLADMVTSRLEQIDTLDVVRVDDVAAATTRASEARETGREMEVDYVLFGSFTRFGEGASLDMQCIAVEEDETSQGPERQIFVQSGNIGNVIPDLDSLVGKISRFAGGGAPTGPVAEASPGDADPNSVAGLLIRVEALEALLRAQGIETTAATPTGPNPEGPVAGPALPGPPVPAPDASP